MGNIWMFPYRTGKFGGAAFLIPYFIFVILLGFSGVIGEMAFGRSVKAGPLGAFASAMEMRFGEKSRKWGKLIGMIPVIGSLGIAIGYSVVVGRFLKYLSAALTGQLTKIEDMEMCIRDSFTGHLTGCFRSIRVVQLCLRLPFKSWVRMLDGNNCSHPISHISPGKIRIFFLQNTKLSGILVAVSYTHIDVYKRQLFTCIGLP